MNIAKRETIGPAKAQQWLNHNKSNRTLREGLAEKYADDMKHGRWTECIAPIAFYRDGDVADGQHRLWAIIESGTTQSFYIVRGLDRAAGLNIDTGAPRNIVDNAHISGLDPNLTTTLVSWCMTTETGERSGKGFSNAQKLALVAKHREAVSWVAKSPLKGRFVRNSIVGSAVARAWYHEENKERLSRFCYIISTGMAEGETDSAAVALRNYIMSRGPNHAASNSGPVWRDMFLKAQAAIWYFMRSRKLQVIKAQSEEKYPLPKQRRVAA